MKVIDLLNKIANEEAPKNIKYNDTDYYLFDRKSYLTTDKSRFFDSIYFKELNDEVEIIEKDKPFNKKVEEIYNRHIDYIYDKEDKKIENVIDKIDIEYFTQIKKTEKNKYLATKINSIIDYINKEDK